MKISRWIKGQALVGLWAVGWGIGFAGFAEAEPQNEYVGHPTVETPTEGISWPLGQALPIFAKPSDPIDVLVVNRLTPDEQLTFSALQGRVNRTRPRIHFINQRAEEGALTWAETETMGLGDLNWIENERNYELFQKYSDDFDGVVLYDARDDGHFRNLAATAAAVLGALPVSPQVLATMKNAGIEPEIVEDLTALDLRGPLEIYGSMLEHWWPRCSKRLLLSAAPGDRRGHGDFHHTRDIAAAVGAAMVWLDPRVPEQRELLKQFFGDMEAGNAVVLGWYATERSGITTASEFGIGTLPADFYVSASVFASAPQPIQIPPVPPKPALENKVYAAIFISDGDNIQYTQHAMRRVWDATTDLRGKFPLNWTIAPGLVDIGPGIMNYYYSHATANDCFVTGPSGMGYLMPTNTLREPGAALGTYLKDPQRMDGYTKLTQTYLERSGLRVVTIWDDASPMLRDAYAANCRNLYGATVQNFKDVPSVAGGFSGDRVRFDRLVIPYAGSYDHLHGSLRDQIRRWDGNGPEFVSYQADIWGELKPQRLNQVQEDLVREFPGKIEFVRADHYFALINEANRLPWNLAMSADLVVSSSDGDADLTAAHDGTPATSWVSRTRGHATIEIDLGGEFLVQRLVVRGAESASPAAGDSSPLARIRLECGTEDDAQPWLRQLEVKKLDAPVGDYDLAPFAARKLRLVLGAATNDSPVHLADLEIHGVAITR